MAMRDQDLPDVPLGKVNLAAPRDLADNPAGRAHVPMAAALQRMYAESAEQPDTIDPTQPDQIQTSLWRKVMNVTVGVLVLVVASVAGLWMIRLGLWLSQ